MPKQSIIIHNNTNVENTLHKGEYNTW